MTNKFFQELPVSFNLLDEFKHEMSENRTVAVVKVDFYNVKYCPVQSFHRPISKMLKYLPQE
jgi:hypothetical protein